MGRQANGSSGGIRENKRCSLIHGTCLLMVFLVISMIHVATSQDKMSTLDQGLKKIRPSRYAKTTDNPKTQSNRVCNTTECADVAKQIKRSMNLTVDPCENFYEFACGRYRVHNPHINGTYDNIVGPFVKTNEWFLNYLRDKLEKGLAKLNGASDEVMKIPSDNYKSCMNLAAIEREGEAPLKQLIREFGGWSMVEENGEWDEKKWDFAKAILSIHRNYTSNGPLFIVKTWEDARDNTRYLFQIYPSPKPTGSYSPPKVDDYRALIQHVALRLGGRTKLCQKVQELIEFESKLAKITIPPIKNLKTTFEDRMTVADLQKEIPLFNWHDHLQGMFFPKYIPKTELFDVSALTSLKRIMVLVNNASKRFYRDVNERYLEKTNNKRWRTCVDYVKKDLKDIVTAGFVADNFTNNMEPIKKIKKMTTEIQAAFKKNIKSLTWIDEHTKQAILDVTNQMRKGIGFPENLLDPVKVSKKFAKYKNLNFRNDTLLSNRITIMKFKQKELLAKFQKPMDKEEWIHFHPQDANVGFNPYKNWMTIPLITIRPPWFYPVKEKCHAMATQIKYGLNRAVNFGSIGQIIGHEITHSFGVRFRKFNKNGEIKGQLWTNKSLERFHARTQCFVEQYSQYYYSGIQVNGSKTLDENLSDNNGLKSALKAYYKWAKLSSSETWRLPGLDFTNEQLFFVGGAQTFCYNAKPSQEKFRLTTIYPTGKFRLIGMLSNSCEFAKAFKCKINSPMNPVKKCELWYENEPLS